MSERMNEQAHNNYRRKLLGSVSAAALLASIHLAGAADSDADRAPVWLELGGQFDILSNDREALALPFASAFVDSGFRSPLSFEKPQRFGYDADGKLSYRPGGSDWVLSASIRYGRSAGHKYNHEQTDLPNSLFSAHQQTSAVHRYAEAQSSNTDSHQVLDFMAGKDLGLGLLGSGSSSLFSAGVRIAQFRSRRSFNFDGDPDYTLGTPSAIFLPKYRHNYHASLVDSASFNGIGPALSWKGDVPIAGNSQSGEIVFDWGINGALLFGKQKSRGHNEVYGHFQSGLDVPYFGLIPITSHYTHPGSHNRSRSVVVPNAGVTAALSFRYADAKISFGYRADWFFGAMDGGLDARKTENLGFHGPFASISIGLGD